MDEFLDLLPREPWSGFRWRRLSFRRAFPHGPGLFLLGLPEVQAQLAQLFHHLAPRRGIEERVHRMGDDRADFVHFGQGLLGLFH